MDAWDGICSDSEEGSAHCTQQWFPALLTQQQSEPTRRLHLGHRKRSDFLTLHTAQVGFTMAYCLVAELILNLNLR
jgi:hypothetical protein